MLWKLLEYSNAVKAGVSIFLIDLEKDVWGKMAKLKSPDTANLEKADRPKKWYETTAGGWKLTSRSKMAILVSGLPKITVYGYHIIPPNFQKDNQLQKNSQKDNRLLKIFQKDNQLPKNSQKDNQPISNLEKSGYRFNCKIKNRYPWLKGIGNIFWPPWECL